MKRLLSTLLIFFGISGFSCTYAEESCGDLHVQIVNQTSSVCKLTSTNLIHGNLVTSPPLSILPSDSKRFDMSQTVYGPAIHLSYECGSEVISFSTQQNYCYLAAGRITGTILKPEPVHTTASYSAFSGSYNWKKGGIINWSIIER